MALASGSTDPRIAVPSQSVIDRFAASTTAGGTAASSRPSTKSTSASITGVLLVAIVISSFHGTRPQREASRKGSTYAERAGIPLRLLARVRAAGYQSRGPAASQHQ